MPADIERLFGQIRRGAFAAGSDPYAVPDNINPAGWYESHEYSSSVGQANLLYDPVFDSLSNTATNLTTTKQTSGKWAGHYVLNSGTAHSIPALAQKYARGDVANNPFDSAALSFSFSASSNATDMNAYIYPDVDLAPTDLSILDWLVGGVKVYRQDAVATNVTTFDVTLELLKDGSVVASSVTHDFLTDSTYTVYPLVVRYNDTAAHYRASAWTWRLNSHLVMSATGSGAVRFRVGEPQIHFNYTPALLPFSPAIGNWLPGRMDNEVLLTNTVTPTVLTGSTNNWAAGVRGHSVLLIGADAGGYNLTGLAGGVAGQVLLVVNTSSFTITMKADSASSDAANRFHLAGGTDLSLTANRSVLLWLAPTTGGWYNVG